MFTHGAAAFLPFQWVTPQKSAGLTDPGLDAADLAMHRYADGEDAAFAVIYRCVAERLHAYLLRMSRSRQLADDLLQETFLRMHRARGSFEPGARLLPWSYAIARNVCIDHARHKAVRKDTVAEGEEVLVATPASSDTNAELLAIGKQVAQTVEVALSKLPPNQREAFILLRYEGMSVQDAASVLGVSEGAVKLRAFHAYEALRAALGDAAPKKRGAT